jgi:multimeric flavodoxin WrbA
VKVRNYFQRGDGDEWPEILEKVKQADILIYATPIWRGDRGSVAKMVAERFDGVMSEDTRENGQYLPITK